MSADRGTQSEHVCACGHEHTGGRVGSCSKFTCPCNHWHPPEEEGDRNVSPRPESAQPEGVAEGAATGSPSSSSGTPSEHPAPLSGRRPDELWEHKRGKVWRIIERIEHEKRALVWANAVLRARIRRLTMQAKRRDEMHSAASETISEEIGRIVDYGKKQGSFSLTIALDEKGDYSTAFIFGREAPDSPMAGGASYGYGDSIPACLTQMIDECRIPPRETLGY